MGMEDPAQSLLLTDLQQLFSSPIGLVAVASSVVAATIVLKILQSSGNEPAAGSVAAPRTSDKEVGGGITVPSPEKPIAAEGQNEEAKTETEDGAKQKDREAIRLPKDLREQLDGKDYAAALEEVLQTTAMRPADLDPKVLRLLDMLEMKGTSIAACRRLREALEGKSRQRIDNWRSYVYSLVRSYDPDAYQRMKDNRSADRPRPAKDKADAPDRPKKEKKKYLVSHFELRPNAPAFIPGGWGYDQAGGGLSNCENGHVQVTSSPLAFGPESADARAEALLEELASPLLDRRT